MDAIFAAVDLTSVAAFVGIALAFKGIALSKRAVKSA
jgi:hypothetical protein